MNEKVADIEYCDYQKGAKMAKIRSRKLKRALLEFAEEMETCLAQKERERYTGWDEDYPTMLQLLANIKDDAILIEQLEPYNPNVAKKLAIDIADRAMMVWYRVPIKV